MLVVSLYYIITVFLKAWECSPRARIWDKTIDGTCISVAGILNTDGVFNTMSDFLIIVVPMKAIWKLQMKGKRKLGIFAVFTVGLMYVPSLNANCRLSVTTARILLIKTAKY